MTTYRNRLVTSISNTPGAAGALTIASATTGHRTFVAGDDGLTFDVTIVDGTAWEVRTGCVYTHSGTSLSRGTLEDSSTGSAITLTSAAVVTVAISAGGYGKLKVDTDTATGSTYTSMMTDLTVSPSSASTEISVSGGGKATFTGSADVSGAGHLVGSLGWGVMNASGRTVGLMIGAEGKLDVTSGTVTVGVITESQLSSCAGTVSTLIGQRSAVVANSGTISTFVGNYFPDHSAISGITTKRCYQSDDAGAPMIIKATIVDQSLYSASPASGATVTIPDLYSEYVLIPGGTLATLTINMPANPIDGQEVCIKTTQAITALTHSGNGKTLLDAMTTMAAGAYATYRYIGGSTTWYRKG